jgi:hypothetical protein
LNFYKKILFISCLHFHIYSTCHVSICIIFSAKQYSKDHGKENYRKIKEIQRTNKERQVETSRQTPMKAVYKPDKFEHVQSRVAQQMKVFIKKLRTVDDFSLLGVALISYAFFLFDCLAL